MELADVRRLYRRLLRKVVSSARLEDAPTLAGLIAQHLGPEAASFPVLSLQWPAHEHVNVQIGLDHWLRSDERTHAVLGVTGFEHQMFTLGDLAHPDSAMRGLGIGSVPMAVVASGPNGATRDCVRCGLYLVTDGGTRFALLLRGSVMGGQPQHVLLEALCADVAGAKRALSQIRRLAFEHNVFRGQVLSFGAEVFSPFGPSNSPLIFSNRPQLERSALILPPGVLDAIERHVVGIARHADRLRASGQHLKRGLLLHGPPGTGKTHTVRYLLGLLNGVTVVILSGEALQHIRAACSIARTLQPAVVVVEDVDLIAPHRGMHPGGHPLLFQLINEMDGLGDDSNVTFLLTTNRADLLEPALAARPGRVDQAVEYRLPDADGRRRLVQLYQGSLRFTDVELEPVVASTEGMTASFIKELLRRAALNSAERTDSRGDSPLSVTQDDIQTSLADLLAERSAVTRSLLGAGAAQIVSAADEWLRPGPANAGPSRAAVRYSRDPSPGPLQ